MKMETIRFSETSVAICMATRGHNQEVHNPKLSKYSENKTNFALKKCRKFHDLRVFALNDVFKRVRMNKTAQYSKDGIKLHW